MAAALFALASCASWRPAGEYAGWSLFVRDGSRIEPAAYAAAVEPAFRAVEGWLGPFEHDVRIHAWSGGIEMQSGNRGRIIVGETEAHDVPGIGPARVTAFHSRSPRGPFSAKGVYLGVADTGTAVHELVHAHFADRRAQVPLWFEEGLAMLLGDGILVAAKAGDERRARWQVDGFVAWPWRELRDRHLTDADITRLLSLRAGSEHSIEENLLVHFLGWAIVFDLFRETQVIDWPLWLRTFELAPDPLAEGRRRLDRTLSEQTPLAWLARLESPKAAVRLAAAKGTWKLRSTEVVSRLLGRLRHESDPEVRLGLAVNALAAAGEMRLPWRLERRLWPRVLRALREAEVPDAEERRAARTLYSAYARAGTAPPLESLARYWRE